MKRVKTENIISLSWVYMERAKWNDEMGNGNRIQLSLVVQVV